MSTSLALLNFERSLPDQPMFELNMHQRSVSGSSLEVQHSSPMTVPGSTRQRTPYTMFPSSTDLPGGTIPNTPGPMQRAFNRDSSNHIPWENASPTPLERYAPSTPVLTPLPGTNLSIGDIDPELVPLTPSINPSVVQIGQENPGYFDIPVEEQPQMDNADMLNGLACLKLANDYGETVDDETKASSNTRSHVHAGHCGNSEEMRCGYEDAKLWDGLCTQNTPHETGALRRKQQAKDLNDSVRAFDVPRHYQILPLRPKQQDEDLQDRVRKDSFISEDWDTSSGERSTGTTSEHTHQRRTPSQSHRYNIPVNSTASASPEECKGMRDDKSSSVKFEYIIWDSPDKSQRHAPAENAWGRHTGLYDGTGYGDDASGPATPCEPDEGTKDVHKQFSLRSTKVLPALLVDGDRSGKKIFTRLPRGEDLYPEHVRESFPLTGNEQHYYESLKSIYHAYAYPFGERVPSSSNNSVGGDVQQAATKTVETS